MRQRFHLEAVLVLAIVATLFAQGCSTSLATDRDAATRVDAISRRLSSDTGDSEREEITRQVHREVDTFLQSNIDTSETSEQIQTRLRTVLASQKPNPDYGDLPFAKVSNLRFGKYLVAAYTVIRPPHNDVATIRAYTLNGNQFNLADTTGADFEGYNMFKAELRPPSKDEFWLLTWGQAHTFNGKKVRFRVYSFDGQHFRTAWSPPDVLDASARVTNSGFVIDHDVRYPPYQIHDEYRVTESGVSKAN